MPYYIDAEKTSLDDLQKRIEETDLVPSRSLLQENIKNVFSLLKKHGLTNLAALRKEMKNTKNISSFSKETGVDANYLTLLRREIEGYFPKTYSLNEFDWLNKKEIGKLESAGLKNTVSLYEATCSAKKIKGLSESLGLDIEFLNSIFCLINLVRIQWVSPLTARMLVAAGYDNPKKIAKADAEKLYDDLESVNKEHVFFKGKIGLRDIKRLIKAASYVG